MQTLTVKLPDTLAKEIAREAKKRRISKSEVVRERLAAGNSGKVSLWDRMKHLVITDDDLPRDLSTNKKHMEGYGAHRSA